MTGIAARTMADIPVGLQPYGEDYRTQICDLSRRERWIAEQKHPTFVRCFCWWRLQNSNLVIGVLQCVMWCYAVLLYLNATAVKALEILALRVLTCRKSMYHMDWRKFWLGEVF